MFTVDIHVHFLPIQLHSLFSDHFVGAIEKKSYSNPTASSNESIDLDRTSILSNSLIFGTS